MGNRIQVQKVLAKYQREQFSNTVSVADVVEYVEMNQYEISEKTIRRTLKELEEEGVIIETEKGNVKCYILCEDMLPNAEKSELYENAEDFL
ncbi:HTH domain-containing protein [Haloarchaeobius baliensis]|uniref:HTH domain-containing protein n=1 Tax=Haloarchaeobius baliensis TaxID=1670458 RepID=UPI003F882EDC